MENQTEKRALANKINQALCLLRLLQYPVRKWSEPYCYSPEDRTVKGQSVEQTDIMIPRYHHRHHHSDFLKWPKINIGRKILQGRLQHGDNSVISQIS